MTSKVAFVVAGLVIVGAVIYYFVNRAMTASAQAKAGGGAAPGGEVDPVTGARWQTIEEANAAADASAATQTTGAVLH